MQSVWMIGIRLQYPSVERFRVVEVAGAMRMQGERQGIGQGQFCKGLLSIWRYIESVKSHAGVPSSLVPLEAFSMWKFCRFKKRQYVGGQDNYVHSSEPIAPQIQPDVPPIKEIRLTSD